MRFATGLSTAALFLPLAVSAATPTPQQILNQSLKGNLSSMSAPTSIDGRIQVEGKATQFKGNVDLGHGSATLRVFSRTLGTTQAGAIPNGEGQFILEKADLVDNENGENMSVTQPVGIEWKLVDNAFYFRAKDVPMEWMNEIPAETQQYLTQWLKLAIPPEMLNSMMNGSMGSSAMPQDLLATNLGSPISLNPALLKRLSNMSVFLVTRVEKRSVVNDKQILRLRVVVNPALITLVQNEQIKSLSSLPRTERLAATKEINQRFTEMRKVLRQTQMVMNVNATDSKLERFEFGGNYVQPQQDCTWNIRLNRSVCTTTGRATFKVSGGFSFMQAAATPVIAPANSLDLMQLFTNRMMQGAGTTSTF